MLVSLRVVEKQLRGRISRLLVVLVLLSSTLLWFSSANAETIFEHDAPSMISQMPATLQVTIIQIDPARLVATIAIEVSVCSNDVLNNDTRVWVVGSGDAYFPIHAGGPPPEAGRTNCYQGNSGIVLWGMYGFGDAYPFDRYWMNFSLSSSYNYYLSNVSNLTLNSDSFAFFTGNYTLSLMSAWKTVGSMNTPPVGIVPKSNSLIVELDRQPRSGVPLLVTILSTYAMIGCSLLIESEKLSARLTVYTAVFVMILGIYFGLGNLLPYHSGYSVVEVLLLGLIICTSIFSCLSMATRSHDNSRPSATTEAIACTLSGIALFALMRIGLYPILLEERQFVGPYPVYLCASAIMLLIGPGLCGISRISKKIAVGSFITVLAFGALTLFTDQLVYYLLFFVVLLVIVGLIIRRGHSKETPYARVCTAGLSTFH